MKRIERGDLTPGTIVEHRTRFLVMPSAYTERSWKHSGRHKFRQLGEVEQVIVGERWRVYRNDLRSLGFDAYWIAAGGLLDDDEHPDGFDTFAEAVAYADKRAREVAS